MNRMEKTAFVLPELMRFNDGTPVETAEQWPARRKEILALFETWMYGKMPDAAGEKTGYSIGPGAGPRARDTIRGGGNENGNMIFHGYKIAEGMDILIHLPNIFNVSFPA